MSHEQQCCWYVYLNHFMPANWAKYKYTAQLYTKLQQIKLDFKTVLPRDAMHSAGICDSHVSIRLSLSQPILYQNGKSETSWFLHHLNLIAPWLHFLARYDSSKNSQEVTPSEGDLWDWGGYERVIFAIFRPISRRISETVQDMTKVTIEHW